MSVFLELVLKFTNPASGILVMLHLKLLSMKGNNSFKKLPNIMSDRVKILRIQY